MSGEDEYDEGWDEGYEAGLGAGEEERELLARERDAYRKAKSENDERFMLELAAAQAQLAEAREIGDLNGQEADNLLARAESAEARLEAVRALIDTIAAEANEREPVWHSPSIAEDARTVALQWAVRELCAALSAAPQPEPDVHHYSRGYPISHAEHAWDDPDDVDPEPPASDEPA